MNLKKRIFDNTLVQVIGKVLATSLNLFAFSIMTRELGQSGFGEYTTVITFLSFFAIFADLGLTLVTVQMLGENKEKETRTLGNLFGLRLLSSIIFISLAPILVIFFDYSDGIKLGVLIAAASFIFNALNQIMVGLFQTRLKMSRVAWAETLSRVIMLLGVILSVKLNWGLNGMLATTTISSLASFVMHFIFARQFAHIKPLFEPSQWKHIMKLSWPLAITIAFNLIYLKADTLILSLFKSQAEVGLYGAAYKIIDVLSSLPFMFAGVILPLMVIAWQKKDHLKFNNLLQKSFDVLAIAAIPMVVGAQFLADDIMVLVAGHDFIGASNIFRLLILAIAAIFLGNMMSHAVIAVKKQKKIIWIYVLTSITSLIGYLILIPKFSYYGAAVITIYSESLIAILTGIYICRYLKFKLNFKGLLKAILASFIMSIFLYFKPTSCLSNNLGLMFTIIIASTIYLLALLFLRAFNRNDLKLIFSKNE
ncbi:MAG: flippase [Clostridia bacterium]|nr:flippase [Clostridia bacterium]